MDPTRGPVAGSPKPIAIHEGLQQFDAVSVLGCPIGIEATDDMPQQMTGQMWDAHPRQNQKASVVGQARKTAAALIRIPPDPLIAGLGLPGCRAE